MRSVLILLLVLLGLAGLSYGLVRLRPDLVPVPQRDLAETPDMLTRLRLARLATRPAACRAALAEMGRPMSPVPDRPSTEGCAVRDAVRLAGEAELAPAGPLATCGLAAAWLMYERHVLQPSARRHLGSAVARVRHLGTYACRDVRGGSWRSQHATANAIDVAGFTLRDGREITVARDWNDAGARGAFLREAHDGACRIFGGALGPRYDAAHRDHFHLDGGRWWVCR